MFQRFDTAPAFLDAACDFLEAKEAANSLMLEIAQCAADHGWDEPTPPFFALASEHGRPAFAAVMTPSHNLLLSPSDEAPSWALDALLDNLRAEDWAVPGVSGSPAVAEEFAERWAADTDVQVRAGMDLRIHQLVSVSRLENPPGAFRAAEEPDIDLLGEWTIVFLAEAVPDYPEDEVTVREAVHD
ncbi:MAG: hypothetical protein GWP08_06490 [Nitrospiraceae bacterium]|nr:hypothetical protein [Nitrospiraceae bacterium]